MAKKKKKLKKGVLFILTIILIGCFYGAIVKFFIGTDIKNIYIYGNELLSDWYIIEQSKLSNYPNYYTTMTNSIEKKLKKDIFIKEVDVKKKFFQKIVIYVTEYKILFYYPEENVYVLENKSTIKYDYDLIDVPILINYVPSEQYEILIEKLNKIDVLVLDKISEIKYTPNEYDEGRFLLYMNDDNYVYVTLTRFDLLNKYNEAITTFEGKKGILYLDSGNYFEIKN